MDKFQRKALDNVEKYYSGQLVIKYNLDPIKINDGINWSYQAPDNIRTYQVYLHSLPFVKDFKTAGSVTKRASYFKEAKNIILDWYKSNPKGTQKWNEHAVSTRIKNLIDFQEADHDYKLDSEFYNQIVNEHCKFLNDERNYKRNNHGLMMDNSLIYSASVLDDENLKKIYLEKALYRIRFALYRDFSRKGVHLENSPEYHRLVLILYSKIKESLYRHGLEMDKDIKLMIENASNYNKYMLKPDLTYPLLGDTGLIKEKKLPKLFKDFLDYEAGIVILNNEDKTDHTNSAYLTFKAGYQSKTHKHYDDLSITYFNFGHDILIDSGKYSYNQLDSIRKYVVSPEGHNMISIKDKLYELNEPLQDQNKMKITRYIKGKSYKLVTGINNLYPSVSTSRHVILTNDDILFIIDGVSLKSTEVVRQNFNINPSAKIDKVNNLKYRIIIDDKIYVLESFLVRNNDIESFVSEGYYSEVFSKVKQNQRIIFEVKSERIILVTALYREDKSTITDVRYNNNQLKFLNNNKSEIIAI